MILIMMAESEQTLVEQFVALKTANSKQQTGQTSAAAVVRARFAGGLWLGVNTAAANESFWRAPTSSSDLSSLGAAVQFARSLACQQRARECNRFRVCSKRKWPATSGSSCNCALNVWPKQLEAAELERRHYYVIYLYRSNHARK